MIHSISALICKDIVYIEVHLADILGASFEQGT